MSKKKTVKTKVKRLLAGLVTVTVFTAIPSIQNISDVCIYDLEANAETAQYSYEITPLLSQFNEYFFVKTDNPDPESFRFADKDSAYSDDAVIKMSTNQFADVKYDDPETLRVNGGYIFNSYSTDGGQVTLQTKTGSYWEESWEDTGVTVTLPVLCDTVDYLIDTYALESDFFANMDAVQEGFSSICLYSGSYIRGELYKSGNFWSVSAYTHVDQSFYIFSPYDREGNKSLFASAIYPFRYDSLGFPSVMAEVSHRLDSSSSYTWSDSNHAYISVTYNGETHTYGGAGDGEGQGLSEDKISRFFTLDNNDETITLDDIWHLLDDYANVEMEDDIPREDALTWEKICNTAGDGAWARIGGGYAYFYKSDDDNYYYADEWGVGYSLYWWGSLGYGSDTWVDGRYIGVNEVYIPGETFEDHPESDIILLERTLPVLNYDYNYEYNYESNRYELVYSNIEVSETTKNVRYCYDETEKIWKADSDSIAITNSSYSTIADMTEKGLIDEKYLDMLKLTYDDVVALDVDRNTNKIPEKGYIFNGTAEPGTEFTVVLGDVDEDGMVNASDASMVLSEYASIATGGIEMFSAVQSLLADVNIDGSTDASDASSILGYYAFVATGGNGTIEEYLNI